MPRQKKPTKEEEKQRYIRIYEKQIERTEKYMEENKQKVMKWKQELEEIKANKGEIDYKKYSL